MSAYRARLLEKANQYIAISACEPDTLFTKALGTQIWLNDKPHLDFASGPGVANIGWNHPEVIAAVKRVLDNNEAGWGGNMIRNKYQIELAEKLCQSTPGRFAKKVFFSNSGGESVEAAVLACMKRRPKRRGLLSFIGDFHGRLGFGRAATTSRATHQDRLPWGVGKAHYLVFPSRNPETPAQSKLLDNLDTPDKYMAYVENTLGPFINDINFALFELVQGEGGINWAKKEFIHALFDYLRDHKVWIIVDEVQTGLGRTGAMWASDLYEVKPDIITVAKALSGGVVQIGATIMREELSYKEIGEHCNTFGANPLACAAGLKALEIIKRDKLDEQARLKHCFFLDMFHNDNFSGLVSFSGEGMMSRLTFENPRLKQLVIAAAGEAGLFLTSAGSQSVRIMPPLTINEKEMKQATGILTEAICKAR